MLERMEDRKCTNCGATLKGGSYVCEFCGTDWTPPKENSPKAIPYGRFVRKTRSGDQKETLSFADILIVIFLFLFCPPALLVYIWVKKVFSLRVRLGVTLFFVATTVAIGVYGYLYETKYTIHAGFDEFAPTAIPLTDRDHTDLTPETVYMNVRNKGGRSLEESKKAFIQQYAGRWIRWTGTVENTYAYSTSAGQVNLNDDKGRKIEFYFDPAHEKAVRELHRGDKVMISGRVWGYEFISDIIDVADSVVVKVIEKAPPPTPTPGSN